MSKTKIYDNITKVSISAPAELIEEARRYEINISKAARDGLARAIENEKKMRNLE